MTPTSRVLLSARAVVPFDPTERPLWETACDERHPPADPARAAPWRTRRRRRGLPAQALGASGPADTHRIRGPGVGVPDRARGRVDVRRRHAVGRADRAGAAGATA